MHENLRKIFYLKTIYIKLKWIFTILAENIKSKQEREKTTYPQCDFCCSIIDNRWFISGLYFVTLRNVHALLVSSVRLLLLLDLIKFIMENTDSQQYVD